MTIQDSAFLLSFGKHSSITDVSSTPGTLLHLLPEKHGFMGADYGRLQPAPLNPTNKRFPARRGVIDVTAELPPHISESLGTLGFELMHGETMPLDQPKPSQSAEAKKRRAAASAKCRRRERRGERRSRGQPKAKRR